MLTLLEASAHYTEQNRSKPKINEVSRIIRWWHVLERTLPNETEQNKVLNYFTIHMMTRSKECCRIPYEQFVKLLDVIESSDSVSTAPLLSVRK